jgi:hypothetical protein
MHPTTSFAGVTALSPAGQGEFDVAIHPEWSIGGKPNGGYLLAILARAAVATGTHPHPIAASAHYLYPPETGAARVVVDVLRTGRGASQLRARLEQDGRLCVEALITTAELDADAKPYWDGGVPAVGVADFERCVRIPGTTPTGMRVAIMDQVDLRLDPASTGFASGRPSGSGELRGWLALPAGEPFDPISLLYAVDAFPPATFEVELTGWVPTLELTCYLRALPAPGPVRILHRAGLVEARRVDEAAYVWDSTGRLVAHSTQLAGIKLG